MSHIEETRASRSGNYEPHDQNIFAPWPNAMRSITKTINTAPHWNCLSRIVGGKVKRTKETE